jgi:sec-independent protein translocase protein TatC
MIRRLLRRAWWVINLPVRGFTWPFRTFRAWLSREPEESSTGDILARSLNQPSLLLEHLDALRRHLLRSVIFLVITTGLSFAFIKPILGWLAEPIGGLAALQSIEVTESIGAVMRVSLLAGAALALPYILFELFLFVNPGLMPRERILILALLPGATLFFVAGMTFAFKIMLPAAVPFLVNFMGIPSQIRPLSYIRFVTGVMFWVGVSFEFPLVIYALAALGIVRARMLWDSWRFAIVGIAVLAAVITPTVDPVNMGLVMAPMIVLYFLSIGLAAIAQRGRARAGRRAQQASRA